jgi:hypothetical protein
MRKHLLGCPYGESGTTTDQLLQLQLEPISYDGAW